MKIEGTAKALTIYIGEQDHYDHRPLYKAVVETLRAEGLAGTTVMRGIEGFGKRSLIHTASVLRMSEDLPMVIKVIDAEDKISRPDLHVISRTSLGHLRSVGYA